MQKTYITISGDTWDKIAYKVYQNERLCDQIMDANREYLSIMIFPAGVELKIPEKTEAASAIILSDDPIWRSKLNG